MLSLLLLLACEAGSIKIDPEQPWTGDDTGASHDDSGAPDSPGTRDDSADPIDTDIEQVGPGPETWPKGCADLYDQDEVVQFDLSFESADWRALQSDCSSGVQSYRPVTFTWGEESVAAQVRLKGNWSWSCDKYQFVISFNEEDPDARFHGLRKIVLDAPWYDHSLLHERVANPLFERLGLPYSCVNNAWLTINGEDYGLYSNVERLDHEYLERHFEEPDGNLYQGGSELKTNEDVGDTSRLTELNNARAIEDLEALADLDQAVAEWAAEAMLPAMDNYWAGVEINYYLYDHPTRGFLWLPYDLDISFGDAAYPGGGEVWPDAVESDPILYEHYGWGKERLMMGVLADETWCERFVEELELARAAYDPDEMAAQTQEWADQIAPFVEADENRPYSLSEHNTAVSKMKAFYAERAAVVDAWLAEGGHCPARW